MAYKPFRALYRLPHMGAWLVLDCTPDGIVSRCRYGPAYADGHTPVDVDLEEYTDIEPEEIRITHDE